MKKNKFNLDLLRSKGADLSDSATGDDVAKAVCALDLPLEKKLILTLQAKGVPIGDDATFDEIFHRFLATIKPKSPQSAQEPETDAEPDDSAAAIAVPAVPVTVPVPATVAPAVPDLPSGDDVESMTPGRAGAVFAAMARQKALDNGIDLSQAWGITRRLYPRLHARFSSAPEALQNKAEEIIPTVRGPQTQILSPLLGCSAASTTPAHAAAAFNECVAQKVKQGLDHKTAWSQTKELHPDVFRRMTEYNLADPITGSASSGLTNAAGALPLQQWLRANKPFVSSQLHLPENVDDQILLAAYNANSRQTVSVSPQKTFLGVAQFFMKQGLSVEDARDKIKSDIPQLYAWWAAAKP